MSDFKDSDDKLSFWINAFNAFSSFNLMHKKMFPRDVIGWYNFYKNSSARIGGQHLPLCEIANICLNNRSIIIEKMQFFGGSNLKSYFFIESDLDFVEFSLFLPFE